MTFDDIKPGDQLVVDWKGLHRAYVLPEEWFTGPVTVDKIHEWYVEVIAPFPIPISSPDGVRLCHTLGLSPTMLKLFCSKPRS